MTVQRPDGVVEGSGRRDEPRRLASACGGVSQARDERPEVTEHALRLAGGGMQVRNPHPDVERLYPLSAWIDTHLEQGGKVFRRRIVVIEDWTPIES